MNEDILADLPPPLDDEPASLRRDIADELGDHLASAFHRELVKSADEDVAKERVLERFGDPRRIARQLWWQAMWSRIMLQKISIGLQSVLVVALIALVVVLVQMQAHQQQLAADAALLRQHTFNNETMLARLVEQLRDVDLPRRTPREQAAGAMGAEAGLGAMGSPAMGMEGAGGSMPGLLPGEGGQSIAALEGAASLSLVLTMETEDGPPAHGCQMLIVDDADNPLTLSYGTDESGWSAQTRGGLAAPGSSGGGLWVALPMRAEDQGRVMAGSVEPGRYVALITFPNGWATRHRIVVRPGEQHVEKIVCPKPLEKAFVTIVAPAVPDDLREAGAHVMLQATPATLKIGTVTWQSSTARHIDAVFDAVTGQAELVSEMPFGETPDESGGLQSFGSGMRANQPKIRNFRGDAAEDRFLVLSTGEYDVILTLYQFDVKEPYLHGQFHKLLPPNFDPDSPPHRLAALPDFEADQSARPLKFALKPGQNTWTLDRAAELFEPGRKQLEESAP